MFTEKTKIVAYTKRVGLTLPLAGLLVGACVPILSNGKPDHSPERLFSVGYENLSRRYIDSVDLGALSVTGLQKLSDIDDSMSVTETGGTVVLAANEVPAGVWPAPGPGDIRGWAELIAVTLAKARSASPTLRQQATGTLSNVVFGGVMSKLDRYSRYSNPEVARRNRALREGFGGLEISIKIDNGMTRVQKVHPGTPAAHSGLKAGDAITHVDGQPIHGIPQLEVIGALRGPTDSAVRLLVERDGAEELLEITVVRALIILPTVTASRANGVLTLKITGFNQGTTSAARQAVSKAERELDISFKGIVLDLRGNPGGLLDQAVSISDLFLVDGRIISTRGRHPRSRQTFDASWGELAPKVPMAILVNGKSASAAEIVAVALRDRGRAVVIGSSSYGKGTVQTIMGLPNGGELTVTWARMHAPSGFALQDHGIIPAICTSGNPTTVSTLTKALHTGGERRADALADQLQARLNRRRDPASARAACPPNSESPDADMEIARALLGDRKLYAKALTDGRPAIASDHSASIAN